MNKQIFVLLIAMLSTSILSGCGGGGGQDRGTIINEELKSIQSAIIAKGANWTAASNEISLLPSEQRILLNGALPETNTAGRNSMRKALQSNELPSSIDWRNHNGSNWMSPIKNQSQCGSCVAFASIGLTESLAKINSNNASLEFDLSECDLYSCGGRNCTNNHGWYLHSAAERMHASGVVDEACLGYAITCGDLQTCSLEKTCSDKCSDATNHNTKIDSWEWVTAADSTAIKNHLIQGPVTAIIDVYKDFYSYKSGVYEYVLGDYQGGHAIDIVGYDEAGGYWIIRNSWGTNWGESGYAKIKYGEIGIENFVIAYKMSDISAGIVTSASPTNVSLSNDQAQTTLTCSANGEVGFIEGRCSSAENWKVITSGSSMTCTYTTAGTYTPSCRVNGVTTDNVDTNVTVTSGSTSTLNYYPVSVGNMWKYKGTRSLDNLTLVSTVTRTITGTQSVAGVDAYSRQELIEVQKYGDPSTLSNYTNVEYIAVDNNTLYRYGHEYDEPTTSITSLLRSTDRNDSSAKYYVSSNGVRFDSLEQMDKYHNHILKHSPLNHTNGLSRTLNAIVTEDTPIPLFVYPPENVNNWIGTTWQYSIANDAFTYIYEVVGLESVTVPAGTFNAYRIRETIQNTDITLDYWFAPIGLVRAEYHWGEQQVFNELNQPIGRIINPFSVYELTEAQIYGIIYDDNLVLTSLTITGPSSAPVDENTLYTATGLFSNGESQDLSHSIIWTSSDNTIGIMVDAGLYGMTSGIINITGNDWFYEINSNSLQVAVGGASICGNVIVESGETCDDGNLISGDGCSATCVLESSGASATVSTFAGAARDCGHVDGNGMQAKFLDIRQIAIDGSGNIYVTELGNNPPTDNYVRKITPTGVVTTIASGGYPFGIAADSSGNVYVAYEGIVKKIAPTGTITTLATLYTPPVAGQYRKGLTVDASGNLYVLYDGVTKITPSGTKSTYISSPATLGLVDDIIIDTSGNIYGVNQTGNTVTKVSSSGAATTIAGASQGYLDALGTAARFDDPYGLDVDTSGNVYVADYGNNRIRKISTNGTVTTYAGSGQYGVTYFDYTDSFINGPAATATFFFPYDVAIDDSTGAIYVVDNGNCVIRKITP